MSNSTGNIGGSSFIQQILGGSSSTSTAGSSSDPFALDSIGSSTTSLTSLSPLTSASPVLPIPSSDSLSILAYSKILGDARTALQTSLNNFQTLQVGLDSQMWADGIAAAEALAQLRTKMIQQAKLQTGLQSTSLAQTLNYNNNGIGPYNSAINSASQLSRLTYFAQFDVANNLISTANYNDQVAIWNSTAPTLNAQLSSTYASYVAATQNYNNQVAQNNAEIAQINAQRLASGITTTIPLETPVAIQPLQQLPGPLPTAPPIPSSPTVPLGLPSVPTVTGNVGVSTSVSVSPLNPAESTFLNSIQTSINTINNGPGAAYNNYLTSTQSFVNTFQDAVLAYQSQPVTPATTATYNAAVAAYNAASAAANTQLSSLYSTYSTAVSNYNATLPSINSQIDTFNAARTGPNEQLIPLQSPLSVPSLSSSLLPTNVAMGPPPPAVNPLSTAPSPRIPQVPSGSSTPTSVNSYLAAYYLPLYNQSIASLNAFQEKLSLQDTYRDYQVFTLPGTKDLLLPNNAYMDRYPKVFFSSGGGGSPGTGVGSALDAIGVSNPSLVGILADAMAPARTAVVGLKEQLTLTPTSAIERASLFATLTLQKAILQAALPALALLGNKVDPETLNSPAARTTLALANLNIIQNLVQSGAIENAINSFLAGSGLNPEQTKAVSEALSGATATGLLQFALSLFARATQLPGLLPQVLGNLSLPTATEQKTATNSALLNGANLPTQGELAAQFSEKLRQLLVSSSGKTFQDVATNPVTVLTVKDALAQQLIHQLNLPTDTAQNTANTIVNNALNTTGALASEEDLKTAILRSAINQGLSNSTAVNLSQTATDVITTEQTVQDIGAAFVKQEFLDKSALIQSILKTSVNQDAFNKALIVASANNFETRRQFQNELASQLQQKGESSSSANNLANSALLATQSPSQQNAFAASKVNQDLLQKSLGDTASQIDSAFIAYNVNTTNETNAANLANVVDPYNLSNYASGITTAGLTAAVTATIAANPPTDAAFRATLYDQFLANGIATGAASQLANNAAIAVPGNDPLKSPVIGDFLSRDALAEQIAENVTSQLSGTLGLAQAASIANLAALTITGTPTGTPNAAETIHADVRVPTSWLNLANDAYVRYIKNNVKDYERLVAENSRELRNPLISTIDLQNRILDPGHNFMKASGLMYKGMGREPSNFKNELSIQI